MKVFSYFDKCTKVSDLTPIMIKATITRLRSNVLFTNSMLSAMTRRRLRKPLRYFRSKTQQNRYTIAITSMNINWIILARYLRYCRQAEKNLSAAATRNNYGWSQLSLCGQKIYLCFKTKTHYVPHNLEIYLVPFFTGQN